jgi:rhamnosyltransferase
MDASSRDHHARSVCRTGSDLVEERIYYQGVVERPLTERTGVVLGSRPPKVSVVIPTLNAGPGFGDLLERLLDQETGFGYEVLVVDSGSTDGTAGLARRRGVAVHTIPRAEFGHGATRNLGVSLSRGEYVAFIVQDALPLDGRWLAAMVENLEGDDLVAGVYGRQVPRPESAPLARALVNGWPTASLERREQYVEDPALYRELTPAGRRSLATFDNVSSCVRRSVWEEIPFERTGYGEDIRWGKSVVECGYRIVYEPRSAVFHSHERGALYDLKRHYVDALILQELFGLTPTATLPRMLLNVILTSAHLYRSKDDRKTLIAPKFLLQAIGYALCSQAGAHLAARRTKTDSGISARIDKLLQRGI